MIEKIIFFFVVLLGIFFLINIFILYGALKYIKKNNVELNKNEKLHLILGTLLFGLFIYVFLESK